MEGAELDVPVLVAGGGLVGLSTALLLGHHGIRTVVVEHHPGPAVHPRAAQLSQRTMEIVRAAGLEAEVRRAAAEQFVQDGAVLAVETLAGRELGAFMPSLNDGVRDVSPSERLLITQNRLERILASRARELGAHLRLATDLIEFTQDDDGVSATVADEEGATSVIRARYLVAADGPRSGIRQRLKIAMAGRGVVSRGLTIYFRAHLAPLLRDRHVSVVHVQHPELRGFFRVEKPFDRGFLAIEALGDPERPAADVGEGATEEDCQLWIRQALGADVPVTVENVMTWSAAADSAERYQSNRVFLAGDAAHVMPPSGAFGGNTGVQDAHNLAWKLAMVLRGEAGPDLLNTYDAERRPVGAFTAEQAFSRYVTRTAPSLAAAGLATAVPDLHVELGYRYHSPAICSDGDAGRLHDSPREAKGQPGARAPHVWLERRGERISALDLFGERFVLLAGPDAGPWCEAARGAAERAGVPIDIHRLGADGLEDADRGFLAAYGFLDTPALATRGAVLVRPDGFVGWRTKTPAASPAAVAAALAQMTFRDTVSP